MALHGAVPGNLKEIENESHEMATLNGRSSRDDYSDDGDNESDAGDEGRRALLGSSSNLKNLLARTSLEESTWQFVRGILTETVPTLMLTTLGLTFTGEMLERVADWSALKRVNELYILIPMLNNLKGNLEMNLSSRLSTAANIGDLDILSTRRSLLLGSLSLLQAQALLVSAVAAVLSFLLGKFISPVSASSISQRKPPLLKPSPAADNTKTGLRELEVLLSTAMTSASISGLVLGSFMCSLILLCRRLQRNPDNITPPVASCLGDLLTLCIVGLVSYFVVLSIDTVLPVALLLLLVLATVFAIILTARNENTRQLISQGWTPLLGAMVISSGTGMVLDRFVNQYEGFGLISIVLGGLPGAVGSIFISRLSTSLHAAASNTLHANKSPQNPRIWATQITLFFVTIPILILFLIFITALGWAAFPFLFVGIFVGTFCCTVFMSLMIARFLTEFLWRRELDPDTYAMPIQSSLVDLLGQLLLVACFEISQTLGADVKNRSKV